MLNRDWSWDRAAAQEASRAAKLVFIPNPNSPSGNRWDDATITALIPPAGLLVLDEAYGDFADTPHRLELLKSEAGSRIVVTRTLSKSYSLAGLRLGYAVAHPEQIAGMRKVKDSYNCDALALAAGVAALEDQGWMLANRERILATRRRLHDRLRTLGFAVVDSQANFLWTTHPEREPRSLFEALKARRILVRFMQFPDAQVDGLRITIGTDAEIDKLLEALTAIL